MKSAESAMMYNIPVVAELNRVPSFDPLRYLKKTADGMELPLKYKKLWFRLKYPQGRVRITNLRITDQLAMIEARVFLDRRDTEAVASYTATCDAKSIPDGKYVQYAQDLATGQALSDAGFGIQFVSADGEVKPTAQTNTAPVQTAPVEKTIVTPVEVPPAVKVPEVKETVKVEEKPVVAPPVVSAPPVVKETVEEVVTESTPATVQTVVTAPAVEVKPVEKVTPIASVADAAKVVTPTPAAVVIEEILDEAAETEQKTGPAYTKDMSVEDICAVMTLDEALNYVVTSGACAGQKLSQVAERRAASLRFYLTGYMVEENILRAAATLIIASRTELQAS
ncbi:MAG: hypothetical protein IJ518_08210 [Clostridia bacterium]|nr:hypothetical protein [Clostridia bacterium]